MLFDNGLDLSCYQLKVSMLSFSYATVDD